MNCFNCEMSRACKSRLDVVNKKKTYSTDIITLKRQPSNEKHQMLKYCIDECEPRQNSIDFESAREDLMKESDEKRLREDVLRE